MATATTGGAPPHGAGAFSADQAAFASELSRKTGLRFDVLIAWVLAEGGPPDNPLNIGPGRHFGDPVKAAEATSQLLHTARYASILGSAGSVDARAEFDAIALSPWDQGRVGPKPRYLALLLGVYQRIYGRPATHTRDPGQVLPGQSAGQSLGSAAGDALDPTKWVDKLTSFAEGAGLRVLAYLVLTIVAIALFVLGVGRLSGVTPRSVLGARAGGGGGAQSEEIPF